MNTSHSVLPLTALTRSELVALLRWVGVPADPDASRSDLLALLGERGSDALALFAAGSGSPRAVRSALLALGRDIAAGVIPQSPL